jgi:hypothetical protein
MLVRPNRSDNGPLGNCSQEHVLIEALVGVTVGVFTIVLARAIRGQHWMYSIGLLVLPGLYALFALKAGEPTVGCKEMIYGSPFVVAGLVFAFASVRNSAVMVGAFWILHALYDLSHTQFFTNVGVPVWYPVFCFSVDFVVGAYLLWLSRRIPTANLRLA